MSAVPVPESQHFDKPKVSNSEGIDQPCSKKKDSLAISQCYLLHSNFSALKESLNCMSEKRLIIYSESLLNAY